jgi:L-aminopeptidase/D-esterase-like protein
MNDTITLVPGIEVGHCYDEEGLTGCTAVVLKEGSTVGVDIRGGAPGCYNTACFRHTTQRETADAIFLTGGSFFGLDVGQGVRKCLEDRGRGWDTGFGMMPCVAGAVIFDLRVAKKGLHPNAEMGYSACENASSNPVVEGNVGAGIGATCGKLLGMEHCMKGGLGSSASSFANGLHLGAVAVVNCIGNVFDADTGRTIAGTRRKDGKGFHEARELFSDLSHRLPTSGGIGENTTIGIVVANVRLRQKEAAKVAEMAHDGLARAIRPAHTLADGDTIFAVATGELDLPPPTPLSLAPGPRFKQEKSSLLAQHMDRPNFITHIGHLASEEMTKAVLRAVGKARSVKGIPSASEYQQGQSSDHSGAGHH